MTQYELEPWSVCQPLEVLASQSEGLIQCLSFGNSVCEPW